MFELCLVCLVLIYKPSKELQEFSDISANINNIDDGKVASLYKAIINKSELKVENIQTLDKDLFKIIKGKKNIPIVVVNPCSDKCTDKEIREKCTFGKRKD